MVWRECARGSLPVHEELLDVPVHHVLLDLGDVVGHIVDEVHVQVLWGLVEHLRERLTRQKRHGRPVHPGVVRGRRHPGQVVLALGRGDAGARELAVVHLDLVADHRPLHLHEGIRSDLVPEAAAARVDHDADLVDLVDAHLLGDEWVVDLLHDLHLRVVVPGAQGPHLGQPALLGPRGDLGGVGVEHAAVLLAMLLVLWPGITLPERPVDAQLQRLLQVGRLGRDYALGADSDRYVIEHGLRQLLLDRLNVG
mmetsp:Transcript_30839/g.80958  ORF Transcript_30839/g.80958 Transcript_30839/m.80958 type:complete len:253 (-) Transcript_30839:552-1310(-)